jgi:hypothetical protein
MRPDELSLPRPPHGSCVQSNAWLMGQFFPHVNFKNLARKSKQQQPRDLPLNITWFKIDELRLKSNISLNTVQNGCPPYIFGASNCLHDHKTDDSMSKLAHAYNVHLVEFCIFRNWYITKWNSVSAQTCSFPPPPLLPSLSPSFSSEVTIVRPLRLAYPKTSLYPNWNKIKLIPKNIVH